MLLQVLRPYVHEEPLPFSFPDLFPVLPKRRHKMTKTSFRLVTGVVLLLTPLLFSLFFTLLQLTFAYPAILSAPTDEILRHFAQGGSLLIATWYGFLFSALLLIPLVVLLHRLLAQDDFPYLGLATTFGILAGLVQVLGLLRWVFLVPYLSQVYMDPASSLATRDTVQVIFQAFHHYAGSGVGEHLGYLFTGLWTILMGLALTQSSLLRPWVGWLALLPAFCILAGILTPLGFGIAAILTQIGYVLWSLWLLVVGVFVLRSREREVQPVLSHRLQ